MAQNNALLTAITTLARVNEQLIELLKSTTTQGVVESETEVSPTPAQAPVCEAKPTLSKKELALHEVPGKQKSEPRVQINAKSVKVAKVCNRVEKVEDFINTKLKSSKKTYEEALKLYNKVVEAHKKATALMKAGVKCPRKEINERAKLFNDWFAFMQTNAKINEQMLIDAYANEGEGGAE